MNELIKNNDVLLTDLRGMISEARAAVVSTVNSALTMLYWSIGKRINEEILKGERASSSPLQASRKLA